jgi:hypothetical protein
MLRPGRGAYVRSNSSVYECPALTRSGIAGGTGARPSRIDFRRTRERTRSLCTPSKVGRNAALRRAPLSHARSTSTPPRAKTAHTAARPGFSAAPASTPTRPCDFAATSRASRRSRRSCCRRSGTAGGCAGSGSVDLRSSATKLSYACSESARRVHKLIIQARLQQVWPPPCTRRRSMVARGARQLRRRAGSARTLGSVVYLARSFRIVSTCSRATGR